MGRKTLFRTAAIDVKTLTIEERDWALNTAGSWGFVAMSPMGVSVSMDETLLRGDIKGRWVLAESWPGCSDVKRWGRGGRGRGEHRDEGFD